MNKIKILGKGFEELEEQANQFIEENQCHVSSVIPFNSVTVEQIKQKGEDGKEQLVNVQVIEPVLVLLHS